MAFNGSGVFVRLYNWVNDRNANIKVRADRMDDEMDGIATGLSTCITKDGQTTTSAAIPFASGLNTDTINEKTSAAGVTIDGVLLKDFGATLKDSVTQFQDDADATKQMRFQLSGITTATTRTVTLPDKDGTMAMTSDITGLDITGLTQETAVAATDTAPIYDTSETANNKAVLADIVALGSLGLTLVNGTLTAAVATNALTIAIKTLAGTDPSATDPVTVLFRNATAATGDFAKIRLTAATSVVVSSGSTLGATSATAFKVWIVGFNDGGTFRLGVINCLSGANIYPLGQFPLASSTAEGGAGAADSAHAIYTGTAVTSKAYSVLGYASWETGLTTAGTWDAVPTRLQLYGLGVPLPGQVIQTQVDADGAFTTGTTTIPADNTIPQNTEGDEYLSQAITPTSAANVLDMHGKFNGSSSAAQNHFTVALFQDTTADAICTTGMWCSTDFSRSIDISHRMLAGTTSPTTFKMRAGASAAGTTSFNGRAGSALNNGKMISRLVVKEIMA